MSDRGLPPDASLACPFLAFEDDRDGRSIQPDHRHRCFAELRPAPRATAHQAAYCLSAGFATCPTFVDWARREAARVRPPAEPTKPDTSASGRPPLVEPGPSSTPRPPAEDGELWPHRDQRREWAAPPPWAATAAGAAGAGGATAAAGAGGEDTGAKHEEQAPSPSPAPPADEATGVAAPAFLASRPPEPPRPSVTPPTSSQPSSTLPSSSRTGYPPPDLDDELEAVGSDDEAWAEPSDEPPMRRFGPAAGRTRHDDASKSGATPPRRRPPADPGAPSWEKPRRYEAYPTLRTRAGLPAMPPILLAGAAIVFVALALFFIPPILLNLGGSGSASPTPSPSGATASATPIASPTAVPSPTPLVYVVKTGDTLSEIAKQYGVSLDDLIAANKATLPNPDRLQPGDELIIPIAPAEPSPSPEEPSPSP